VLKIVPIINKLELWSWGENFDRIKPDTKKPNSSNAFQEAEYYE